MVFRRLRKRGRDRARSSERRRLGKAFQKDGPRTAKLLRWAVASLTLGTTRSPCWKYPHSNSRKNRRKLPTQHRSVLTRRGAPSTFRRVALTKSRLINREKIIYVQVMG